jgi:Rieske Fe-S protein
MQRRVFLKQSCVACFGLAGAGLLLEGCGSALPLVKLTPVGDTLSVPAASFTAQVTHVIVRCRTLENDILLVKENDTTYKALYLRCTHEGVGLTATDKKIFCSAHGSIFDFNGNVVKEPALRPLKQFKTSTDNTGIIIHLS